MICRNCQREIGDGAVFCAFCGASQRESAAPPEKKKKQNGPFWPEEEQLSA